MRCVRLHRCRDARKIDDGEPFRCGCSCRVSDKDAQRIVRLGRGRWKRLKVGNRVIELHSEVVMLGGEWRPAKTITADDIEKAFVCGELFAIKRIEEFRPQEGEGGLKS